MSETETVTTNTASNKSKATGKDKKPSKSNSKTSTRSETKTSATAKKDTGKEDEKQRLADIEKRIRRRITLEEKAFRIVEQLLDNPIEEEYLLDVAKHILPSHFTDLVEERAIIHQCGYPVCRNMLKNVTKQKYHISLKSNQVYDISERKKFCSNQCFKAAKYFEEQLNTTPLWLRDGEQIGPFHLLHRDADRGCVGDAMFEIPGQEIAAELRLIDKVNRLSLHDSDNRDDRVTKKPQMKQCKSLATNKDDSQDIQMSNLATASGINVSPAVDLSQIIAASLVAGDSPRASHGRDVVVLDNASSSGQVDSTMVLPKSDNMPVPSCDIVHCNDMTPIEEYAEMDHKHMTRSLGVTPVEECAKMDEDQKTEALMRMLDRRDEFLAELDQHHESVEDGQDADTADCVRSSSPHQVKSVKVLTDSGTSQEDMPKHNNPAGVMSCVEPAQVASSSCDKGHTPSQESVPDVTVVVRQEDGAKSSINIIADAISKPALTTILNAVSEHGNVISKSAVSGTTNSKAVSEHGCVSSSQALANIQRLKQMQSHKEASSKANKSAFPVDTIWGAVREWKTAATATFLHSDKHSDDDDDDVPKELAAGGCLPNASPLQGEEKLFQMKVCQFYRGVYPAADASETVAKSPKKSNDEEMEIVLPPVDSRSQMALRRKIVLDKLTKVLPLLLSPLKLSLSGLVPEIRRLVHTFRLTSENILFRPPEWTLLGLILLKALCVKVEHLRSAFAQTYAVHYTRSFVLSMKINETDVEEVVDFLCSAQVQ